MKNLFYLLTLLILIACKNEDAAPSTRGPSGSGNTGDWAIPQNEVRDGGPGKDGIPSVDQPKFASVSATQYLADGDLVIGVRIGNEIRAYPHPILDWHEIVNDDLNGTQVAVTYCPLTGTAIGWNREVNNTITTFGVSGLLYNTNLIPYDRATDSEWSQMRLDCVHGELKGTRIETVPVVETTWKTWRAMYPTSKVMTTETGFSRNYGRFPYGPYRTDHDYLIFSINPDDSRLPRKERVLGVIVDGQAKAYRFENFTNGVTLLQDNFRGKDLVIAGSRDDNFLVAYESILEDGTALIFTAVQDSGKVVMSDNEGNEWDFFGTAVSGPRQGSRLPATDSYIGYWLGWGAFYPNLEINRE